MPAELGAAEEVPSDDEEAHYALHAHRHLTAALTLPYASLGTVQRVAAADPPTPSVTSHVSTQSDGEIRAYWTPERIASAVPFDVVLPPTGQGARRPTPPRGPERSGPPALPGSGTTRSARSASISDTPGMQLEVTATDQGYVYPFPFTRYEVFTSYVGFPYDTIGRAFFTNPSTNQNGVCSAAAVNSENKSVVWTAGHCVNSGGSSGSPGTWYVNWFFVPAFKDGLQPYGAWTYRELASVDRWTSYGEHAYDMGAVVVNPNLLGQRLVDVTGGLGYHFNAPRIQHWHAFGYPDNAGFYTGQKMVTCAASYATSFQTDLFTLNPEDSGIGCDMDGGASGGPWVKAWGSDWQLNGVNSVKLSNEPLSVYSPYLGDAAVVLYEFVRAR